ncbi:MAG TPA: MFS transporter [Caulobacteraceae bacterium]|nr:MFS transporter [Caulobacteraceae bacterium]
MTQAAPIEIVSAPPKPLFSDAYSNWVVVALMLVYTSNFIDRTIVATISQAIKIDMKISDFQVGLLGGLSFAILYTILGVPIARLADRHNRVTIISVSLAVWSGMTALCGLAANFTLLLLCRVGVGIGEAGCSPSAQSLIADYYTPAKRATALSVYSFGIPLGAMIGAISGGLLTQAFGWRVAFIVVGLPGVLLALLVRATVKEPPRGYSEPSGTVDTTPAPTLWQVAKRLFGRPSFRHMTAGVTLVSFAGYGIGAFGNLYFQRRFGLNYAQIGVIFGLIGGVSTGAGTLLGGWLADRLGKADWRWYAWTPAIGVAIATPISLAVYLAPSWTAAAAIAVLPGVFGYCYLGPTWGVMHNLIEPRARATATALLFFVLNFIALGGGPPITGALIDVLGKRLFAARGVGDFLVQCPGGVALHPAMAGACHATLATATQYGIILTMITYVWGSLHYVLAARTIRADMAAAAATPG